MAPGRDGKRKIRSETIKTSKRCKEEKSCEVPNIKRNLVTSLIIHPKAEQDPWINHLPQEVLSVIFSYLTLRDRKNARSVCKNWFNVSNQKKFLTTERLYCCAEGNTDIDAVIQTLENSQRVILNLVLRDIDFNDARWSPRFWIKCGPKITYLGFVACTISDEVLKLIILHCDKMVYLMFDETHTGKGQPHVRTGLCLDELIALKVSRKSLEYFAIQGWARLSNNFLRALFTIYPNMKHLHYNSFLFLEFFESSAAMALDDASLRSTSKCTFAIILKKLINSQKTLESFSIGDASSRPDAWASEFWKAFQTLQFQNLKEISVLFRVDGIEHSYLSAIGFFSRHKQLETVKWFLPVQITSWFLDNITNSLLEKCPCLKELDLYRSPEHTPIATNASVFTNVVKSNLESLTISCVMLMEETSMPVINKTLKTLRIMNASVDVVQYSEEIKFADLFRNFCGLTKIEVDVPFMMTDVFLQSIIKYQPNLVDFKIYSHNLTDYGLTGIPNEDDADKLIGSPIQKLKKLKYLNLLMTGDENCKITEKTLAVLKFPNLKFLFVYVSSEWKFTVEFLSLIPTFSELELLSLTMDKETIDLTACLKLCGQLKWLTYFNVKFKECKNFDEEAHKSVFKCCPSLRFFSYKNKNSKRYSYFYDVITRSVVNTTQVFFGQDDTSDDEDYEVIDTSDFEESDMSDVDDDEGDATDDDDDDEDL